MAAEKTKYLDENFRTITVGGFEAIITEICTSEDLFVGNFTANNKFHQFEYWNKNGICRNNNGDANLDLRKPEVHDFVTKAAIWRKSMLAKKRK